MNCKQAYTTRSNIKLILGIFLLLLGLSMVYDIKPLFEGNGGELSGWDKVFEIGPYTGDWGVNGIGTAFILAAAGIFIKWVFPTRAESRVTEESISCFKDGLLKYEFQKEDIAWIEVSHRGQYGTNRVTVKLLAGEESDLHMIYFPSFSDFETCLEKYGYPRE